MQNTSQLLLIFFYSFLTAIACGIGALPFFWWKNISKKGIGIAKSIAAGLMIAASFDLIQEGTKHSVWGVFFGILIGMGIIFVAKRVVERFESKITFGPTTGKTASQLLLFFAIMTVHSGVEGIAMGFAFGPSWSLGLLIVLVMAIQNIPEGLAIASLMVPKGVSPMKALGWSILSSLPQPIIAVPAFLFVSISLILLPYGLGFAAGAMLWMSLSELLPEAIEDTPKETLATIITVSIAIMVLIQYL